MTSDETFYTLKAKGVTCRTDMGLYSSSSSSNILRFASVYGAPQQVKAIFSVIATFNEVILLKDDSQVRLARSYNSSLRFRGFSIGYGKQHGIIWDEKTGEDCIIWTSRDERLKALYNALSKRKVPFDKAWLPKLELLLGRGGFLSLLQGWGGIGGYECSWDDDAICDKIVKVLTNKVKRQALEKAAA